MHYFVHSTLTQTHQYTQWSRPFDPHMSPEIIGEPVVIKGGANRATFPDDRFGRFTPKAVTTEVTERQMEYLNGCTKFKKHMEKGFLTVTTSEEKAEKIARDMQPKDNSAPLTPGSPEFNKPNPETPEADGILATAVRVMKSAVT